MGAKGIVLAPNGRPASVDPFYNYQLPTEEDLPMGWKANIASATQAAYHNKKRKLRVMLSVGALGTRGEWIHVSYSHTNSTPNHKTAELVKKLFVGDNREAIANFPIKSRYVDSRFWLHLWSPLDPRDKLWPRFENYIDGAGLAI